MCLEFGVMKWQYFFITLIVCQLVAAAEKEMWYDAKGQPIAELPADAIPTTQPSDLVANDQALIRAAAQPWHAGRRYSRLRDWYINAWNPLGRWTIGTGWFYRTPHVQPRFYGGGTNRCGNSWSFSYRSPGFYLQWHR